MKVFSLINQKGGVGKTTSAISIASYLGRTNKVLLIDLDPQGNATSNCGISEENLNKTIKDLILNDRLAASECIIKTDKGFDLIGSNIEVADTELNMVSKFNRENLLKTKLKNLDYDYIILDCSPSLNLMTINALVTTDLALIPIEPHIFSVKGISSLMETIENIRSMNETIEYKFFITKFDGRNSSYKVIEEKLRGNLDRSILKAKIRIDNNVRITQNDSKTIFEGKGIKCTEDYKNLVEEIING